MKRSAVKTKAKAVNVIQISPPIAKGDATFIECETIGTRKESKWEKEDLESFGDIEAAIPITPEGKQYCKLVTSMNVPYPYKKEIRLGGFDRVNVPMKKVKMDWDISGKSRFFHDSPGSILRCMILKEKIAFPNPKNPKKTKEEKNRVLVCDIVSPLS